MPRITVSGAWSGKNIAALHDGAPRVDDREHISPGIGDEAFRIQNIRLPGFRDRRRWRVTHLRVGPIGDLREVADRLLHGLASRRGVHLQPGDDIEEQTARPAPSRTKFRIGPGIMGPGNRIDLSHGGREIVARKPLKRSVAPLIQWQLPSIHVNVKMRRPESHKTVSGSTTSCTASPAFLDGCRGSGCYKGC